MTASYPEFPAESVSTVTAGRQDITVRKNLRVPMRDGVNLAEIGRASCRERV